VGDDRGGVSVRVLVAAKHLATYANDILRPLRLVGNGTGAQGHDQRALHLVSEKRQRASVAAPEVPSLLWHSLASRAWPNSQASGRGRDSIGRQGCVAVSQKGPVRTDGLPMTRVSNRRRRGVGSDGSGPGDSGYRPRRRAEESRASDP